ncbi:MAG: 7-carboxy-7-deazaguanine synthase, partial [Desulfobacterales bacterium]|nr:7-carboxy-7-deazaguanine synthase [Desulfobacterales bacterium]
YCDTRYAYEEGEEMDIGAIVGRVSSYRCPLVEVTGGEPLIQKDTPALARRLLDEGYRVLVETNGSKDISRVDDRCVKIVDIKCPASGESGQNDLGNLDRLTEEDEIKFVIGDRDDYEYAKKMLGKVDHNRLGNHPVHFAPVFGKIAPEVLAKWILQDGLDVRLQIQLQKIIWSPEKRGV